MPTDVHFVVKPELRSRLALLHGSRMGYLLALRPKVNSLPETREVSQSFLNGCMGSVKATPLWLVVALTRIAEEDPTLTRENAVALSPTWFNLEGEL